MPYNAEVLRYLRRKNPSQPDGFDPISWLGAEQRFVTPIRNSKLNNLEEQVIFGTDTYTITYEDADGNQIIEKSFCKTSTDPSATTDFYKIETIIYKDPQVEDNDIRFDGTHFKIDINGIFLFGDGSGTYPYPDTLYCNDDNIATFRNTTLVVTPTTISPIREDKLYFVKGGVDTLILTKYTGVKSTLDGKLIIHERIVNAINP